jgi:hypothetical protein
VRPKVGCEEFVAIFDGEEWIEVGEFGAALRPAAAAQLLQFGRRIPTNAELCELPGLIYGLECYIADAAEVESERLLVKIRPILGVRQ